MTTVTKLPYHGVWDAKYYHYNKNYRNMEFGMQGQCIDVNSLFTSKLNNFIRLTALCTAQTGCWGSSQQRVSEQTMGQ